MKVLQRGENTLQEKRLVFLMKTILALLIGLTYQTQSLLGPLLFVIYINDFRNSSEIMSFILLADDFNIFCSHVP